MVTLLQNFHFLAFIIFLEDGELFEGILFFIVDEGHCIPYQNTNGILVCPFLHKYGPIFIHLKSYCHPVDLISYMLLLN